MKVYPKSINKFICNLQLHLILTNYKIPKYVVLLCNSIRRKQEELGGLGKLIVYISYENIALIDNQNQTIQSV